jgi:hypothetical protein
VDTQTQPRRAVSAQPDPDVTEIHVKSAAGARSQAAVVATDDPPVVTARTDRSGAVRGLLVSLAVIGVVLEGAGRLLVTLGWTRRSAPPELRPQQRRLLSMLGRWDSLWIRAVHIDSDGVIDHVDGGGHHRYRLLPLPNERYRMT